MSFYNIAVEIYPCADSYDGILGNANGRSSDDFDVRNPQGGIASSNWNMGVFGSTNQRDQLLEKEYLAFLAKDFARQYRITPETSLFDYGFNQSTYAFTDESFPRVHRTLGDMNDDDRRRAQRECERRGFSGSDLSACIYDNGFLRIEPTPQPNIPNRTVGRQLDPVRTPTPNVNPGQRPYRERYPEPRSGENSGGGNTGGGVPRGGNTAGNGTSKPVISDKPINRETTKPTPQNPESTTGGSTTRPVTHRETSAPVETKNPGLASDPVKPVKTPEPVKEPEVVRPKPVYTEPVKTQPVYTEPVRTQPVYTEPVRTQPIKTEPVRTEPRYTPPPSNPVSTPVQRPASPPVSTPVSKHHPRSAAPSVRQAIRRSRKPV